MSSLLNYAQTGNRHQVLPLLCSLRRRLPFSQVLDKSPAALYMDSAGSEPGVESSAAADSRHAILPLWHAWPR